MLECSSCSSARAQVLLVIDCSRHMDVSVRLFHGNIYMHIYVNGVYISDSRRASAHARKEKLPLDSSVHYASTVHGLMTSEHARKMKLPMLE